ncbi:MAG TPA: MDR family MFS transporter [Longimicrobiales bacterium]|nr:MDR family MFS transporter [Longimicrobiales bacterium]
MQPGRERKLVTAALLAGMFLAALEATAVATAMPTAVADLGGMERFSWVFSAYLLTSTTTVPLYGKLADLHGRLRIYLIGMTFFLLGSILSGAAASFEQLILFRAIQGLGAGGVMPVSITIVGDIFTLEERGRMQGLFSGVWGLASLIGPALGGLVTDSFSWRYVFFFAVPFGLISAVLLSVFLREREPRREHKLDLIGTALLTMAIALLLIAILEGSEVWGWSSPLTLSVGLISALAFAAFLRQERVVPEPTLPLDLFQNRVIAVSSAGSLVLGALLFALTAFVPMFAQGVLGGTAKAAGVPLIAMSVGWPLASATAGRLMIRTGYRRLVVFGAGFAVVGVVMLAFASRHSSLVSISLAMLVLGIGNGFVSTPYLVAVQNAVPWNRRGVATSSGQFFRTIGGAVAVAAFGAVLNARLRGRLGATFNANAALDADLRASLSPGALENLTAALAAGLHAVFVACAVLALAGLVIALFFPPGSASKHAHQELTVTV